MINFSICKASVSKQIKSKKWVGLFCLFVVVFFFYFILFYFFNYLERDCVTRQVQELRLCEFRRHINIHPPTALALTSSIVALALIVAPDNCSIFHDRCHDRLV